MLIFALAYLGKKCFVRVLGGLKKQKMPFQNYLTFSGASNFTFFDPTLRNSCHLAVKNSGNPIACIRTVSSSDCKY